jgi:hypothetical protein
MTWGRILYKRFIEAGIFRNISLIELHINETCDEVRIVLLDACSIQNCVIEGDSLSSLLFTCSLECALRNSKKKEVDRTRTEHICYGSLLMVLISFGENGNAIKRSTQNILGVFKEADVKLSPERRKYLLIYVIEDLNKTTNTSFKS